MGARAVISTICYKIKQDIETDAYRNYTARCLRILTENTSATAGYCSGGKIGSYLQFDFDDIINPKPQKEHKKGEIADKIKSKLR